MKLLLKMLKKRYKLCVATIIVTLISIAITLVWNSYIGGIIDNITSGIYFDYAKMVPAIILIILGGATAYILGLLAGYTCETLNHDMRMGYAVNISNMDTLYIEDINSGESMSKLQNELSDVSGYISNNLFGIVSNIISFVGTLIYLLFINPMLTLSVNLPVVLILLFVVYSSKTISVTTKKSQRSKVELNRHANTLLILFPIIRIFDVTTLINSRYNDSLSKWKIQNIKMEQKRSLLMSLSGLMSSIPTMLLFLIGGYMAINGNVSIGNIYIFLNLSGNVSGIMMNMPSFIAAFRQFTANMDRIKNDIVLIEEG